MSFFKKYQDTLLVALGFTMIIFLIGYYIWGLKTMASALSDIVSPYNNPADHITFDIKGAEDILKIKP